MTQLSRATLHVEWHGGREDIPVQYNPTEYTLDKQARIAEVAIPGIDAPLQQFVRGETEKLTLDLFFDTTDLGMGEGATSVATWTDKIYQLAKIEPTRHAPPTLVFIWGPSFPGRSVGGAASATAPPAGAQSALDQSGTGVEAQRREGFRCVLESVKQKFTLFSPQGVPLRATLTCTFRQYRTLEQQLGELRLSSPDRTHVHALRSRETLAALAHRYYDKAAEWRPIAEANEIDDPRRLSPGRFLQVPALR